MSGVMHLSRSWMVESLPEVPKVDLIYFYHSLGYTCPIFSNFYIIALQLVILCIYCSFGTTTRPQSSQLELLVGRCFLSIYLLLTKFSKLHQDCTAK